ncbi:MAG: Nuclease inhibitor [Phycisphaerales bacterium]|nr:Nuclease inhibitor [Phycisphaerales bacterium]
MNASYFPAIRQLAEYEVWCNRQIIDFAGQLPAGQLFQQFPFGLHTIHETLFHVVEVFQTWGGCVGPVIAKPAMVPYDRAMPLGEIADWNAKLATDFLAAIDASHAAGLLHQDRRIVQAFHLVTHGTHHRTQLITMFRLLGKDPPFEAGDFGGWSNGR